MNRLGKFTQSLNLSRTIPLVIAKTDPRILVAVGVFVVAGLIFVGIQLWPPPFVPAILTCSVSLLIAAIFLRFDPESKDVLPFIVTSAVLMATTFVWAMEPARSLLVQSPLVGEHAILAALADSDGVATSACKRAGGEALVDRLRDRPGVVAACRPRDKVTRELGRGWIRNAMGEDSDSNSCAGLQVSAQLGAVNNHELTRCALTASTEHGRSCCRDLVDEVDINNDSVLFAKLLADTFEAEPIVTQKKLVEVGCNAEVEVSELQLLHVKNGCGLSNTEALAALGLPKQRLCESLAQNPVCDAFRKTLSQDAIGRASSLVMGAARTHVAVKTADVLGDLGPAVEARRTVQNVGQVCGRRVDPATGVVTHVDCRNTVFEESKYREAPGLEGM